MYSKEYFIELFISFLKEKGAYTSYKYWIYFKYRKDFKFIIEKFSKVEDYLSNTILISLSSEWKEKVFEIKAKILFDFLVQEGQLFQFIQRYGELKTFVRKYNCQTMLSEIPFEKIETYPNWRNYLLEIGAEWIS